LVCLTSIMGTAIQSDESPPSWPCLNAIPFDVEATMSQSERESQPEHGGPG